MDLTAVACATLALSLFVSAIKVGRWILNADPRAIINAGRWALLALAALALAALLWLIASDRWTSTMLLMAFMLPIFVQAAPRWRLLLNVMAGDLPPLAPDLDARTAPGTFSTMRSPADAELVRQSIAVLKAYLEHAGAQIEHGLPDTQFASRPVKEVGNGIRTAVSSKESIRNSVAHAT
jgi:hypothetical protein